MWRSRLGTLSLLLSLLVILPDVPLGIPPIQLRAETTSAGPVSEEEAKLLWSLAEKSMDEFRFQDAIHELQRYVDRYPAQPSFIDAHFQLGKAYLQLHQPQKALPPLKFYVEAMGAKIEAFRGRLWLARAYVQTGKYQEALLTTLEIQRFGLDLDLPQDILQEGLLVQSSARIALKDGPGAERILNSLRDQLSSSDIGVRGEYFRTQLQLQNYLCSLIGERSHLRQIDEAQIRHEISRQGSCFQKSLNFFQSALELNDRESAHRALQEMHSIFQSYIRSCLNPPAAVKAKLELADFLSQDCKRQTQESLKQLSTLRPSISLSVQEIAKQFKTELNTFLIEKTKEPR